MENYIEIKQKNIINDLITFNENNYIYDKYSQSIGSKKLLFILQENNSLNLKPSTLQLLLYILAKASILNLSNNHTIINIPLNDYLKVRHITNAVSARRKIKQDLDRLIGLHIKFENKDFTSKDKNNKPKIEYLTMNLFGSASKFTNGQIQISLTPEFIAFYNTLPKMLLPTKIFAIETRYNPNAFYIIWALSYLNNINRNNKDRLNKILVRTLLEYCPTIPNNYDFIKRSGQTYQRIITPFERDMNKLKELNIIDWYYTDIFDTKQQKEKFSLYEFLELKIHFNFKNLPNNKNISLGKVENDTEQ